MFNRPPALPSVSVADLAAIVAADGTTPVLDVREPYEFASGHVPTAEPMPMSTVPSRLGEIPRDRTVYLICQSGGRSGQAVAWLNQQGYDTVNVEGGTGAWILSGHPVA